MEGFSPKRIAIIGLGYVGLPLAVAFARHWPVLGFDINEKRVQELQKGWDRNREVPPEALRQPNLRVTSDPDELDECDVYIVTVPTPVDKAKRPDLGPLTAATRTVARYLKPGDLVVYESTVYPGCTEEVCIPLLEEGSGLKAGRDFKVGYSPERINPGDKEHTLENVVKVVGGMDAETTESLAYLYGKVVKAGVHKAPDIRTAEAAKVIENVQRDLNIALINELAMLFHVLDLDTHAVLEAAGTKWNFLRFTPGLVGGHCIPVDPYYLTYKAQEVGFHPELILAGRRINDGMGRYVAQETVKLLIKARRVVPDSRVLVLGATFKENVPDARNSRVVDLVHELQEYGCHVEVYDPLIPPDEQQRLGLPFLQEDPFTSDRRYEAVILAVPHRVFLEKGWKSIITQLLQDDKGVIVDVRGAFRREALKLSIIYWAL